MDPADWSWAGPPLDVRPVLPAERAELTGLLHDLQPGDWLRPTACPGWRVRDVVAHIVHDYIRKLSYGRDQQARPGLRPGETLPGFLHRSNQEFVDAAAGWSPRLLTGLLSDLGPQLDRWWAAADLGQHGEAVSWAAPGVPAPAWLDIAREYSEYWVHQQQVRDATGRPGADSDLLTGPVVDVFLRAAPQALAGLARPPGTCAEVAVTGPGSGRWTVSRAAARWAVDRRAADVPPAARIRLSSATLWRAATRGITAETAIGRAEVTGDQALGSALLHLVAIIR